MCCSLHLFAASHAAAAGRGLQAAQKANILPSLMGKGKGAAPVQQQYVAAMPLPAPAYVAAQPQYVVAAQPQYVVAAQPQVQVRL